MSSTLVNFGTAMSSGSNFFQTSLMDMGGPSINVFSQFCCTVAILSTVRGSWIFFMVLTSVVLVGMVLSYAIRKGRKYYGWSYRFEFEFIEMINQDEEDLVNLADMAEEEKKKPDINDQFEELKL
jgi:hypothetical protein